MRRRVQLSGAPAERQRSASGAPAERQRSASGAPAEREWVERVSGGGRGAMWSRGVRQSMLV
jgi:hypothetical protein